MSIHSLNSKITPAHLWLWYHLTNLGICALIQVLALNLETFESG